MNTLSERVKFAREKSGLTQTEVSELTGMTQPSFQKIESGATKRTTYIQELASVFGVNPHWLATGQGQMTINNGISVGGNNTNKGAQIGQQHEHGYDNATPIPTHTIKVAPAINSIQAGAFTTIGDNTYDEYLPYFGDYGDDNIYWLCIDGDSMLPDFKKGEYVLINKDRQPTAGNYVAALQDGEEKATFKKYRPKGFDDNGVEYWQLIPSNEEYPVIDSRYQPFVVIGVAVERNQRLV